MMDSPNELLANSSNELLANSSKTCEVFKTSQVSQCRTTGHDFDTAIWMSHEFDYSLDYKNLDLKTNPSLYRTGRGEQGVLLVEPYKSEILPYWKFKTPDVARKSARKIYSLFKSYKRSNDFVGMDMARKFLQMGYTRSRRYANHKSGRKYDGPVPADKKGQSGAHGRKQLPRNVDTVKAESAQIFHEYWQRAKADKFYQQHLKAHKEALKHTSDDRV